ncbi:ATPase [Massilia pinisoli]|uniref:ATPase n=1 Tax=Massilia pinisoli TaxID=1772194 RepID=A0ABT1ZVG6_9BURK|nr:BadF/BadG/BcrA/BcrD ATPase family protein [Massilia pinisoli]MCS0583870.1 ATPase [Massilia pinisoli]
MIDYLIGVDGGGTGTRVRIARRAPGGAVELAQGAGGPSGLGLGIARAWVAVQDAVAQAFAAAGIERPSLDRIAIGLGLAGVHNRQWAKEFEDADPGYAALRLETDAFTTLMGAHGGRPGAIVAIGTGSVGEVLQTDGTRREVGGWGFPAGDEASGGWIGLAAINHIEQVLDGRRAHSAFAADVIDACGGHRAAIQVWLGQATQTAYATLAPLVLKHADDPAARAILTKAGEEAAAIARALDPDGSLPLALCGGLGAALRDWLPAALAARARAPEGDSARGALNMIELHVAA